MITRRIRTPRKIAQQGYGLIVVVFMTTALLVLALMVAPNILTEGKRYELFGESKGVQLVVESGAPLLAQLPIDPALTQLCDAGRVEEYQSPDYDTLAQNFVKILPALATQTKAS
jgi:competence protein ComGC